MTTRFLTRTRAALASLGAAAIALAGVGIATPAAAALVDALPPLVITEVMQDNAGTPGDQDYFEFYEVTNTTATAIDVADYRLQYNGAAFIEAVEPGTATALADVVIPANGTAVFWLRYAVGSGDAAVTQWQLSEADFRQHYGDGASTYPLFHAIGQAGFANSGARTLRVFEADGTTLVSGSDYNRAATNRGNADHFRMPETGVLLTDATAGVPTPGTVGPEQLVRPEPEPEPEPEPTEPTEPGEPTEPTEPTGPGAGADGNAGEYFPLVITEIYGDNPGTDLYEYVEVTNTTTEAIDLTAAGIGFRYHTSQWNAGSAQPFVHLDGEGDTPVVIAAGMSAVFWLNYAEGSAQRGMTKEQFRTAVGADAATPVYRFGPQAGIANGGDRGFSLVDAEGTVLTRAWAPADADPAGNWNAHFAVPGTIGSVDALLVEAGPAVATSAGTVTLAQVTSALSRPTDPALAAPLLQITELAPDTANVGGGDAYEFVEVYNASDAAIDFGDYTLSYLYTDNALGGPVTLSSTLWPAQPSDVTIAPGGTLVLWVKNPAGVAAGLTVADFNTAFGTDLVLGETIVELYNGGMSNGGSRGIQVRTNTGHDISRAYYFADDQTTASTAIQYGWNSAATVPLWVPPTPAGTVQTMIGLAAPTPGAVSADQVPAAFVAAPAPGTPPTITDLTGSSDVPDTADLDLGFDVTDDVLVRSVTLSLTDNLGATETRSLGFDAANRYYYSVPAADLFGKRWIEYTVIASDGSQESALGPVRVDLLEGEPDAVRLNLVEGQFLGGEHRVTATADSGPAPELTIDGTPVADPIPSLETGPVFAFEATSTDAFFRNGVLLGDDVLKVFDEGYYSRIVTVDATVPVDRVVPGEPLTLTIVAGTKAWPEANVDENNDDFVGMNLRLALPDGRVLRPAFCATTKEQAGAVTAPAFVECPAPDTRIAFSDANLVSFLATFDVPDDAFTSVSTVWDTTAVTDGSHVVAARTDAATTTRTVQIDNTAPVIESPLVEGERYRGQVAVDATATDAGSGVSSLTATLDGNPISLPLVTSSLALAPGEHVAEFTATDAVGNTGTRTVTFETVDEQPAIELDGPSDGEIIEGDSADLTATPGSPEEDALDLSFREGYRYAPGDTELTVTSGTVTDSATADRSAGVALGADDLQKLLGTDGVEVETTSTSALPYQLFTVAAPEGAGPGSLARVDWRGRANSDAKVTLYARTVDGVWETVDQVLTTDDAPTDFTLEALVPVDGHVVEGELTFLVQHSEGFAATDLSTRESAADPFHPEATARAGYDFTIAIESDTQYYNETPEYYRHQLAIHEFLREERANLNLQYLIHNGDIVNVHTQPEQWANADAAYRLLDEAGLPYGVLAGNHDVGGFAADYTQYSRFFGEARFAGNPWYGESYKDNRGHYDLVSVGGVDFLFLYMGWPTPNDVADNTEDIAWMNDVIRQYPERKVWLNLHEYMLTTGGLGPFPQRVFDEVVAANPNVFAVSSGHYHDAYTRTDDFDDDGDGVADRTVYSMLFDYQGLPEGGLGYLRLAHFDNENGRILFRTYSPSLMDFTSDDPSLNDPPGMQEFEIPYAAVGITPQVKTLATDSFQVEILTANEIGAVADAASGQPATVTWNGLTEGEHGWYVIAEGPFGGVQYSALRSFTTIPGETDPGDGDPGDGDPGDGDPGDGDPGDGDPGEGDPGDGDPGDGETVEPTGTVTAAFGSALVPGGRMQVDFTGFQPGEEVRFVLHSTPMALGETLVVGADGILSGVLLIPTDAASGTHRLEAVGASGLSVMSDPFTISTPAGAGQSVLPFTGVEATPVLLAGLVLLLLGVGAMIVVARRRRSLS
ncbi:lamin tail domain-containing protein [Microbacterium sp. SLBN-146]|uniref:lamin tail domain-containing protein n=1 Tax=Microbacterium sp. SLBN-146 TaxID=2768457 RepID=UPI00116E073A|nr:lamin tail domain-containing protein [Microbacterium sp. SLBN-146]TQJ31306.1 lamin tail-like protein [Microbacterium sp. SLBN-146]